MRGVRREMTGEASRNQGVCAELSKQFEFYLEGSGNYGGVLNRKQK